MMTDRWSRVLIGPLMVVAALLAMPADGYGRVYSNGETPEPYIIKGKVTVVFEDDVNLDRLDKGFGRVSFGLGSLDPILEQFSVTEAAEIFPGSQPRQINSGLPDYTRFYELSFPETIPVNEVIDALLQNPNIRTAEPVWALPLSITPDDPQFNSQWHMTSLNVNVRAAWDHETGSDTVIVADVDSGVNYNHSDLEGNIWVNPGEDVDGDGVVYDVDDLNGIDDDGNGTIDDLIGYDFFTGISNPHPLEDNSSPDPDPMDRNGHGTHVGGIMAAMTNNGVNVTGMAGGWFGGHRSYRGVRIMCLRVGALANDGFGYVNSNNCGTAMQYAARNGAKIINCSWGSSSTTTMNAAMQLCDSAGMTVTHAAGNDGVDQPDYLDYDPYDFEVLSVASVEGNDCKTSWSNYGYWVDISAYGSNILSTYSTVYAQPTVAYADGTSMAAPMVAGLAALIRSAMPSLNKYQVDSIIINTAHDIYDLSCNQGNYLLKLGSGRIDAEAALAGLASAKFTSDITEGPAPLTVNFTDQSPYSPTAWDWDFGTGDGSTDQNPTYVYNDPGIYDVSLIVDDSVSLGPGEEHLTNYIWVTADTVAMPHVVAPRGSQAVVPVYMHNTVQIKGIQFSFYMENAIGITFDSFSVVGLRTEYFDNVSFNALSTNKKYGILMVPDPAGGGSNYLQPDTGAILNLYFNVPLAAPGGGIVAIDSITASGKRPRYDALWGELVPVFNAGAIEVQSCMRGDVDCSGGDINIADLVYLVDFMFNQGPAPDPYDVGNIDGLLLIDIADLVYLVDYMFNSGPPPPP